MLIHRIDLEMKRLLYITNIEVPYRVRFFNDLEKYCELTVLYERKKSSNRDIRWANSEKNNYTVIYLDGLNIGTEYSFSFGILKHIFGGYDVIIIGCYNSPVQMFASLVMRICRIPFIISTDGEIFLNSKGLKRIVKQFFLAGACKYFTAGEKAAESLGKVVGREKVEVYYFSSLYSNELKNHAERALGTKRDNIVLVVGQYYDYKGMDIAYKVAKRTPNIQYRFVGMGKRTEMFIEEQGGLADNVEIIPFLSKKELEKEYEKCAMLMLPSRQECWGLVVNEAAAYGMPIVSTWGSGAAIEFLADSYPQYLAKAGDSKDLYQCILRLKSENKEVYSEYLIEKSRNYNIEKSIEVYCQILGLVGKQED